MKCFIVCLLGAVVIFALSGCAADLSTGNGFIGFTVPPAGKSLVYMVRDENFMAQKMPYIPVFAAKSDGKGKSTEEYSQKAIVGKDMFVPILMEPGTYLLKTGAIDIDVTLKPDAISCFDVGGKYRGLTIFLITEIEKNEDCKKILASKSEGVQLAEAFKRIRK